MLSNAAGDGEPVKTFEISVRVVAPDTP